jgi:lysozyme
MKVCNDGLRLIQQFEGAPRLKARLCEGGAWELSYGVTFHPDGRPVQSGETCTEDYALEMFRHALGVFEQAVSAALTVPVTQHQFSALVALAYNIGAENFAKSTVLRETNANRVDDAAAAFGMWIYATKGGHKQAYRGLLRRRYSEACLYLGYDWTEACEEDAIALKREPPVSLPGTDKVIYKTPFKDVLRVAQRYPLAVPTKAAEAHLFEPEPPPSAVASPSVTVAEPPGASPPLPVQPPAAPAPVPEKPVASSGASPSVHATGPAVVQAPAPPPVRIPAPPKMPDPPVPIGQQTGAVDGTRKAEEWSSSAKAMWQSRRFYGLMLIMIGRGWMLFTGSNALLGAVSDPLVMEFVGGFCVMLVGEAVQAWGQAKATRPLR